MTTDTLNKVQDAEALVNDKRKEELLSKQVEHIDITSFDARPIVEAMGKMSFTSRDLARATDIYNQMLADPNCSVWLVWGASKKAATVTASIDGASACASSLIFSVMEISLRRRLGSRPKLPVHDGPDIPA